MSLDPASQQLDEETPLLRSQGNGGAEISKTPLPWRQLSLLLVVQIAEPLAAFVIFPFAPQVSVSHEIEITVTTRSF